MSIQVAEAACPSRRGPGRLARLVVLLAGLLGCEPPDDTPNPVPEPGAIRARTLAGASLNFRPCIFDTQTFPTCRFGNPEPIREILGPYKLNVSYYNRTYQSISVAREPGPYGALIEVRPADGPPIRRFKLLYRTPEPIPADWRRDPDDPDEMARLFGLDPALIRREGALIERTIRGRRFGQFAADPAVARLLVGLGQSLAGSGPGDSRARCRRWWVGLKRRLDGLDREFPRPVVAPWPIDGPPAPVLRVGTESEAGLEPGTVAAIDAACRAWAADSDQGFAVCIARRGVIALHAAYGQRNGEPMTVRTRSRIASITKTMSAILLMILVDQGLVDLDAPVSRYLPAFRGRDGPRPLTVRHLYTHTAGLQQWPTWSDDLPDLPERISDYAPLLHVGRSWNYHPTGYMLGGRVIEAASGEALPDFYRRHLLGPLGCFQTDVSGTHTDARSVPLDMAKIGQMLLNRGSYGPWRFIRASTFARMLPRRLDDLLGPRTTIRFGIGLTGDAEHFGHAASSAAIFDIDTTSDLVVIMTRDAPGRHFEEHNARFWAAIRAGIERECSK